MTFGVATASTAAISVPFAPRITLIPAEEVLSLHTESLPTGGLAFREVGGARVRLITSTDDPEILNRGDGSFHPADLAVVLRALEEIPREFLDPLDVQIFILPYPRSGRLSSSADGRAIYLSPGVRAYEPWQVAFLVTHEIGHCVHRHFLPESAVDGWSTWAVLRGVANPARFHDQAAHANRPNEIFAEDFRVLFGGAEARGDGTIENPDIASPLSIPGLRAFYQALAGIEATDALLAVRLGPNPARVGQSLTLRLSGAAGGVLEGALYDLSGRLVSRLTFAPSAAQTWTAVLGSGAVDGGPLASGAYWLRLSGAAAGKPIPLRILR